MHKSLALSEHKTSPDHRMTEKFENAVSTLKTHQIFSDHSMPEKVKTQQSPVILDLF